MRSSSVSTECLLEANPRIKNQRYCSSKDCQRTRKRCWQKEKLATDPDYKANQRDCHKKWLSHHPRYYQKFRQRNKANERNKLLQKLRDSRRRSRRLPAKMDRFKPAPVKESGHY